MIATPTALSQAKASEIESHDVTQIAPVKVSNDATLSAPKTAQSVTRNEKPAKSSELMGKRTRKPTRKRAAKPPAVTGYHFRRHGAGWDLRKDVYVTSHDGVRKRKQPYVAHLSRVAFQEMKRQRKGAALERAIGQWIAEHDR